MNSTCFIQFACKEKKPSCVLGVPVAAATHTCIEKSTAVESGLPLIAAKKSSLFY